MSQSVAATYEVSILGYGASEVLRESLLAEFSDCADAEAIATEWAPAAFPEFCINLIINIPSEVVYGLATQAACGAVRFAYKKIRNAVEAHRSGSGGATMNTVEVKFQDMEITILGNLSFEECSCLVKKIMAFVQDTSENGMPVKRVSAPCVNLENSLYTVSISGDGAMPGERDYNLWLIEAGGESDKPEIYDCVNACYISGEVVDYSFYNERKRRR